MTRLRVGMNAALPQARPGGRDGGVRPAAGVGSRARGLRRGGAHAVRQPALRGRRIPELAGRFTRRSRPSRATRPRSGSRSNRPGSPARRSAGPSISSTTSGTPSPRCAPGRRVVTIHDLQPIVDPRTSAGSRAPTSAAGFDPRLVRASRRHDAERVRARAGDRTLRRGRPTGRRGAGTARIAPADDGTGRRRRCRTRSRAVLPVPRRSRTPTRTTSRCCGRSPRSPPPTARVSLVLTGGEGAAECDRAPRDRAARSPGSSPGCGRDPRDPDLDRLLPASRRPHLPVPTRGIRLPGRRGDGARMSGHRVERHSPS